MRKFLTILFTFFILNLSSQEKEKFPQFYIVNGDTVGITLSIEQAQKIDNDIELLELYKELSESYNFSDTIYINVVNDLEEKVANLEFKISMLESKNNDKNLIIDKLRDKIDLYVNNEDLYEKELDNKDEIISRKDKIIKKQKKNMLIGGISMGLAIIGSLILLIF